MRDLLERLGPAQRIVGGSTALYIVWVFLPWYTTAAGGVSGFRLPTVLAWLGAVVALVGVVLSLSDEPPETPGTPGAFHMYLGIGGLVITILGMVLKPDGTGYSWPSLVALGLACAWAYGGLMWHNEPDDEGSLEA